MRTLLVPAAAHPQTFPAAADAKLALTLLGPSRAMSQLWTQIRRLAPHVRTVLLTGPSDCGQEAVARLLLDLSPAPRRPFLVLEKAEAEERLSRPNALHALPIETFLFLPEIERLSPAGQHGLLRLLRTRRSHGFSVIAATSEDLRALVGMGRFSPELAEALGSVRIAVPALKDRLEDLPMLLNQMFSLHCHASNRPVPQLSEELLRTAMQHVWPGNLQELNEVVDSLLAQHEIGENLQLLHLHAALRDSHEPKAGPQPIRMIKLDAVIQEHIYAVLQGCRGNKLRAAEVLGISRSTLYRMLDAAAHNAAMPLAS